MQHWADEPPPETHPDPMHPGVRKGEEASNGLRVWDSCNYPSGKAKDGAGWVAVKVSLRGNRLKRFNIRTCGSWRLAFLLARMQRDLWENEDLPPRSVAASVGSPGCSRRLLRRRSSAEAGKSPGKRLLRRQSSLEGSPTKRLRKQDSAEDSAEKATQRRLRRQKSGDAPKSKLSSVLERIRARVKDAPSSEAA